MNPQELKTVQQAESSLQAIEDFLENANNQALYLATGCLVEALKHMHEADPTLLNPTNRIRIEALLAKQKMKSGRDSFNTGF